MSGTELKVKRNEGREDIKTAFIFSCPGQEELKSGLLVNGQTGKNLDMLLTILNNRRPDIFPSTNRYEYRITNSSEIVHYKALDNRTEAKPQEINAPENLKRLKADIVGYDYVITFGRCSAIGAESIKNDTECKNTTFVYSQHLSFMSLNSSIKTDINGKPIERGSADGTYRRIEVVAKKILDQITASGK